MVSAVVERMDIRKIERSYSRLGRIEYPPRILLKILVYGYMRRIYSSRELERACRENILKTKKAPSQGTISTSSASGALFWGLL